MSLSDSDRYAIVQTAKNLGLNPYEFGAVLQQESGIDANIWGGAGGNYYGVIQFGGPERQEAGLDPERIRQRNYTVAEQMPHVEKWLKGRGFKPGMGVEKVYATILGGNPDANIYAQDSNQTSVANSLSRFLPGGVHYETAKKKLGNVLGFEDSTTTTTDTKPQLNVDGRTTINYYDQREPAKKEKVDDGSGMVKQLMGQLLRRPETRGPLDILFDKMKAGMGYMNPMQILQNYTR